jgi:hypothetical protein
VQSPTHMNYSSFQPSGMAQNSQNRSRTRAASATLLDLRTQFRGVGTSQNLPQSAHSPTSRTVSTSGLSSGSSNYTASFPSAPLTAPIDFSMPRTPGAFRTTGQDYSMPQMSAPIAPPNDFSQAFQSMSGSSARTPIRDTFSSTDRNDQSGSTGASATASTYGNTS